MESYDHLIKYNEDGSIKSLRASQLVNEGIITINIYDEELSIKRKRAENDIFEKQIRDIATNERPVANSFLKDLLRPFSIVAGPWTILQNYIQDLLKPRDHVLYYHTPDLSSPEDSPERNYYQLIVSDNLWLKNYCFCIDENNELNIMEQATILAIVVELPSSIP
ncbi:hypothetical protein RhiirA1_468715 [Rhizophagus irregularis]|uniref:Uncharacterized protein n=1 Tax=Rhizophagus irregularis TaxID=588596 RepID=A0A2I1FG30_9GLOM|nr:hypothetical protein RhiirA1_468715 [Rhizophagus irregularis]PKY33326.1 hypothetical protein RhiirB3_452120 [Rhizophagus irregularis]